ncbi:MAG: DUF211 domain-containing protein [Candidatus Hadarchaeales archaeon]
MSRRTLKKIVLDVLKPHAPTLPEFAEMLTSVHGVASVNITLIEIDQDTETIKVAIEGDLNYEKIKSAIEERGGVVHSIDEVSAEAQHPSLKV